MRTRSALLVLPLLAGAAHAQCTLLAMEDFGLGPRQAGGNGNLRTIFVGDNLNGIWAREPHGARWRTTDGTGVANWIFAASSDDYTEPRQNDEFNGTGFSDNNTSLLLPFTPPATPFTFAVNTVMPLGFAAGAYVGFTSATTATNNFQNDGVLYITVTGEGNWTLYANGAQTVASGTCDLGQPWDGWTEVRFTYDPAQHSVSGKVGGTFFGPYSVSLTRAITFVGAENIDNGLWSVINKLVVLQGPGPTAQAASDTAGACPGATVTMSATSTATGDTRYQWFRDGFVLDDGLLEGTSVSGAHGPQLTLTGVSPADAGGYTCLVSTFCGWAQTQAVALTVGGPGCGGVVCNDIDFNGDGLFPDTADIDDFLSVFSGGLCPTGSCDSIDFNNDGLFPDTTDIDSFLSVFSGGPCL
ncbi:MAG: immunoglobulin domain-containing protein [Phycisphaerales bacterium]